MKIDLTRTLAWRRALAAATPTAAADRAMLEDLQGNILKGHGRAHSSTILVSFDRSRAAAAGRFVAGLGREATTALAQLVGAHAYRTEGLDAGRFLGVLLSARGYEALGRADAKPAGAAFEVGMAARDLNDPPAEEWEAPWRDIHALILVAAADAQRRDAESTAMLARIAATTDAVTVDGVLDGDTLFDTQGRGIEHFGFVCGRSQPLALQEDVDDESTLGGTRQWDPAIPLGQLLVRCPGGRHETSHGSFVVVRKLEQHVRPFKTREAALAKALAAEAAELEVAQPEDGHAGACVVGRFGNGRALALDAAARPQSGGAENDFDYGNDPRGLRCPHAAHIRKTNPRSDVADSKAHLMARRGMTYGARLDDPNDGRLDNKPDGGVGLLFMACQADIENQFEFTQNKWADNRQFASPLMSPGAETGIDPLIGQWPSPAPNPRAPGQLYPVDWGRRLSTRRFEFSGFATMRGGEYLFAPSVSFLKSLGDLHLIKLVDGGG